MIKVGFIPPSTKDWMGGVNYFKNLFYALSQSSSKDITPIIFIGTKADPEIKIIYEEFGQIIENSIFDRKSMLWFVNKLSRNFLLERILKKNGIKILSHAGVVNLSCCKNINWIPDFQHLHLPEMFSSKEIRSRNRNFHHIIKESDVVILSSYSALDDFKKFSPKYVSKVVVIQFVSQPASVLDTLSDKDEENIKQKYGIKNEFFYLPNQFWPHKNHCVAFEALNYLKKKGLGVTIVCSGVMTRHGNDKHVSELIKYVDDHDLKANILFLGLIPYPDVFLLMKISRGVINPSLFEGWSSTVEECKSVGMKMILSDLDVHKEQYPSATFFEKNNSIDLAEKMESFGSEGHANGELSIYNLDHRTQEFSDKYKRVIISLMKA